MRPLSAKRSCRVNASRLIFIICWSPDSFFFFGSSLISFKIQTSSKATIRHSEVFQIKRLKFAETAAPVTITVRKILR